MRLFYPSVSPSTLQMKRILTNSLLLVAGCVLFMLSACSEKKNFEVLPADKLEAVLYDYHLAQVMVGDLPSNQRYKRDFYFDYVYEKHGVTKGEIDSSLVYYARYPKGLSEIYASLSKRIEADIKLLDEEEMPTKKREATSVVGDSVDLWYDICFVEMNASPLGGSRYTFTIPTDTNFKAFDRIRWSGEVLFLDDKVDSLHKYLHLNLRVAYMNDSIVSSDTLLHTSGVFSIAVCDSAVVKSIDGAAYFKSNDADERLLILSPSLLRCRSNADLAVVDTALIKRQVEMMTRNAVLKANDLDMQIVSE